MLPSLYPPPREGVNRLHWSSPQVLSQGQSTALTRLLRALDFLTSEEKIMHTHTHTRVNMCARVFVHHWEAKSLSVPTLPSPFCLSLWNVVGVRRVVTGPQPGSTLRSARTPPLSSPGRGASALCPRSWAPTRRGMRKTHVRLEKRVLAFGLPPACSALCL